MNKNFNLKFSNNIESLREIAKNSNLLHKHGACLIQNDKIISYGYNKSIKEIIIDNKMVKFSIHAEMNVLFNLKKINYTKNITDILIIRIGNSNKLKNSRPCNSCIDKMIKKGIRKVYYSDENGNIKCEFVDSMLKLHISSGHNYMKNYTKINYMKRNRII